VKKFTLMMFSCCRWHEKREESDEKQHYFLRGLVQKASSRKKITSNAHENDLGDGLAWW
jgi:hypothetical protein